MLGILCGFHAERCVAACTAAAGEVIVLLHLFRQREEAHERIVGAVDQGLGNAMAANASETPFAIRRAQFGDECVAIGIEAADIQGRNVMRRGVRDGSLAHVVLSS